MVVYGIDGEFCVMFCVCLYCVVLIVEGEGKWKFFMCFYYVWSYDMMG